MKIKKQNILINNAGAGFLISSTGVIYSTGAWGCSHQIYYSFSASASLLRIHSLLITISSSSRRSLKSLQCEEANSYILSMMYITLTQRITSLKKPTDLQNVRKKKKRRLQKQRKQEKNSRIRNRKQRSTIWNFNKK